MIVGVLDTGIWPEHPSYSDPDPAGKPYAAPPAAPVRRAGVRVRAARTPAMPVHLQQQAHRCRRGSWPPTTRSAGPGSRRVHEARDDDGHGTHTSSTAAGNAGVAASHLRRRPRASSPASRRAPTSRCSRSAAPRVASASDSVAAIQAADRGRRRRHQLLDQRRREPVSPTRSSSHSSTPTTRASSSPLRPAIPDPAPTPPTIAARG